MASTTSAHQLLRRDHGARPSSHVRNGFSVLQLAGLGLPSFPSVQAAFLVALTSLAIGGAPSAHAGSSASAPNIVVITVDGLGIADLGYNGAIDIETPNIDRLAAAGTVFTNAYATMPRSSPARAGLLTGRHPARFGLEEDLALAWLDAEQALPTSEQTIARHLRRAGYRTGLVGKWHLGAEERRVPLERGFDYFFGFIGRGHDYWRTDANALADEYLIPLVENHRNVRLDGYLTDVLT